ncbi:hypothetical protein MTR_3g083153 [Medicago truncatula]|uniref:Uncharacterized protein n=1 Tax=Medicago truncatula TaxID=3880 RepID=A0A072V092_MEDTR|nr:hypothetical protein MTR_3g083153 [Medicago truncatula]
MDDACISKVDFQWNPGNVFPAEFTQNSAGKSAGKAKNSSNGWTCYKESWNRAWALAQASWGWLRPCG